MLEKFFKPKPKSREVKFLETLTEKQRDHIFAELKIATEEGDKIRKLVAAMTEVARYLKWKKK